MQLVRRTLVPVVLVLAASFLVGASRADTGSLGYSCALPVIGPKPFPMTLGTNAPATVYLGTTVTPRLTTVVQVSAEMANLMAQELKAATVAGTITGPVGINGVATPVLQTIRSTPIPASNTVPLEITATASLPALVAKAPGTVTYLPDDVEVTLDFTKANGTSAGSFSNLDCTMPATTATIDKVTLARSPSRTAATASYAKAAKKVTSVVKVSATSRLVPTGTVTVVLARGRTTLRTAKATLSRGSARIVLPGKRAKGTYKVVAMYAGSSTTLRSTTTRTFTVR